MRACFSTVAEVRDKLAAFNTVITHLNSKAQQCQDQSKAFLAGRASAGGLQLQEESELRFAVSKLEGEARQLQEQLWRQQTLPEAYKSVICRK